MNIKLSQQWKFLKLKLKNSKELQSVAVKDLLKQAYKASKVTDLNYVKDTFLDFCKNQTLKMH
jgi:hypothetical protein